MQVMGSELVCIVVDDFQLPAVSSFRVIFQRWVPSHLRTCCAPHIPTRIALFVAVGFESRSLSYHHIQHRTVRAELADLRKQLHQIASALVLCRVQDYFPVTVSTWRVVVACSASSCISACLFCCPRTAALLLAVMLATTKGT
jgi:hypothetical protein